VSVANLLSYNSSMILFAEMFSGVHCTQIRYNRQMACIVAPVVCGCIGILLINSGLIIIRRAYNSSKANPVPVSKDCEQKTVAKIEKRLAVSVLKEQLFTLNMCY
jgi:hypothetical protein